MNIRFAADTIIRSNHLLIYTPSSSVHASTYKFDSEFFQSHQNRSMLIRQAGANEFDEGFDVAFNSQSLRSVLLQRPTLWVLVFGNESLFFSTPVYRGSKPFFPAKTNCGVTFADTSSDSATLMLLAEMYGAGGIDNKEFEQWRAKWFAAIARHNQALPDRQPDELVN